jgi:hypothetical protein
MRIELRSIGGFTGPAGAQISHIDTECIAKGNADRIAELVRDVNFFSLPGSIRLSKPRSWDFLYTITVKDGSNQRTLEFHKDAAPAALQKLVDIIEELELN